MSFPPLLLHLPKIPSSTPRRHIRDETTSKNKTKAVHFSVQNAQTPLHVSFARLFPKPTGKQATFENPNSQLHKFLARALAHLRSV
jgi:hypothetical protein